ncbi:SRPBCC family protein [Polymorphobacter sp. PAMC 29334]|uniref:SRPBCC family protein n=1 Tax=Polymorphobacter sp. PAMC 29334 TaxID=2862331 RepID=UPI001C6760CA|nr:SRPBCC family protein [Polymorphobacter sp. PAMC 29334]QYE36285.1 SRPBCC family protein [Polymorphobacter sp. PAMC 29334]
MLQPTPADTFELSITRLIAVPRAKLYRCWTDPALIVKWFTPPPFTTVSAEMDVRPGGASLIVMRAPDVTDYPNRGQYLDVILDRRLVFTDAYTGDWQPSAKPFMTGILTFDDEGEGTRYTAVVRHWTAADRDAHVAMGFETGWGIATDQLAALAATL